MPDARGIDARNDDPARIPRAAIGPGGRIDPHHNPDELFAKPAWRGGARPNPAPFQQLPRPHCAFDIGQQFAVQLLPPQPRPAIFVQHRRDEARRQVRIVGRPPARHRPVLHRQLLDHRHQRRRLGRGGDENAGIVIPAHRHHQIVPCHRALLPPFGRLVAPGGVMLWPAQFLGGDRRKDLRHRAGVEHQFAACARPARRLAVPRHRQDPAWPVDHHALDILDRRADQRDARARPAAGKVADPFGARARLAEAAPGHDQPHPPIAHRRALAVMRPAQPARDQLVAMRPRHRRDRASAPNRIEQRQPLDRIGRAVERGERGLPGGVRLPLPLRHGRAAAAPDRPAFWSARR
jgi:hypothetical protein